MNSIANNIKLRLSLREPLKEALDIVAKLSDELILEKVPDNQEEALEFLRSELDKVKNNFITCTNFQRDFPSIAFSIATGVGKTRLMGACIAYLYLHKGIKNFFVLAPNLTIYDKLIEDFGNPAYHKYVFNGISEFVHNRPVIITGDNYNQQGNLFREGEIRINIFNISKFNSDNKGQKKGGIALAPKIKRLSEYLGQSYWEYLAGIQDLVILMDEAHRYHADASKNAINELKPILGLELTATPFDEKQKPFQNVVYEYSLAQALTDGTFVKNPAIATRKNFKRGDLSDKEIEIIKLEDAISIHQDTKTELEIYSKNNGVKLVKPFILVVCKDINHAREVFDLINSDEFYQGEYKGKVLQIDSSTKKEEEIEKQFLSLESPDNEIEIVIHVNMLKEGWDVTNLYTIVPLRAANAAILVEQTIGRGLRLPYDGKRTGVDKIDKLTVVAHENFEAVIAAAQDPNSVLNKMTFIEISEEDLKIKTEVVTSKPVAEKKLENEQIEVNKIESKENQQKAQNSLDAKKAIINALPDFNTLPEVRRVEDLNKEEVKRKVIRQIEKKLSEGQQNIFADDIVKEVEATYEKVVASYKENIIEIPRMDLVLGEVTATFNHFDLDTTNFNYQALEQEIIRMGLMDKSVETLKAKSSGSYGNPINMIISELIDYSDIDYDDNADLLYKLATQAYNNIEENIDKKENISQAIFQFKSAIADKIYLQMKANFTLSSLEYVAPKVYPFTKIEQWNFSVLVNAGYKDYRDVVTPTLMVPKYVFRGFEKACHFEYKFDSKTEQDLAFVLENDNKVIKWLRPASNQFRIYWDNNSKRYEPDFIVETEDTIYMVEPKSSANILDADVIAKKDAALKYCKYATEFTSQNNGKPWKYLLVPHNEISRTINFDLLINFFS
ncbi:DEAD/DEAH box helicase family protein [Flavobacterium sp. MMLR14_040]|uniref:DEAD/DEAH box helicase n=1 Tax=Flavobacterium sp. MMLR14_040 TaxID=3093843 RepID=UPI00298F5C95|nr:DEAD/DEAH box helicase family protein [Flavobacterium sp. MMLR14_040]MDW8850119.1 DEAD/DEAH box helicase family protein [Flavobacterium sp. MMLR14_040]